MIIIEAQDVHAIVTGALAVQQLQERHRILDSKDEAQAWDASRGFVDMELLKSCDNSPRAMHREFRSKAGHAFQIRASVDVKSDHTFSVTRQSHSSTEVGDDDLLSCLAVMAIVGRDRVELNRIIADTPCLTIVSFNSSQWEEILQQLGNVVDRVYT